MKRLLNILLGMLILLAVLLLGAVATGYYLYRNARVTPPEPWYDFRDSSVVSSREGRCFMQSRLRHSRNGFWEISLEGDAEERGAAFGALTDSLLYVQESGFVEQIRELIPSSTQLSLLHKLTVIHNRHLEEYIPEEYCREIAAMSRYCTHEYDFIGSPYMRQLNYHAAHDIGHAMQGYMLVGCTALGVWGEKTEEGKMIVARNFDFYVGERFAANRLLTFCRPSEGYAFVSIGWPGMIGVLSGMNERGLTLTLNAAQGDLPLGVATPVSILAREILQYASTIEEAVRIASRRELFVSESLLIGSARDGRCAVIEKSPERQALYMPRNEMLLLTNHFQSEAFATDRKNRENIRLSDSAPRMKRLRELSRGNAPIGIPKAISILRDHRTAEGRELGLANPMAINQQIAHHSVVFSPEDLTMWICTKDWGMGRWVKYDVGSILRGEKDFGKEICEEETIPADSLFELRDKTRLEHFRHLKKQLSKDNIGEFILTNPENWATYEIAGDALGREGEHKAARDLYEEALKCPMPEGERLRLKKKLKE